MITDNINVKCQGQTVTKIVDGNGDTLANLTAEVENADQYVKPVGKKAITANGTYNVAEFAEAEVNVEGGSDPVTPSLAVSESGLVTASGDGVVTTTHQITSSDDPDLIPENIVSGVTIFGVSGSHEDPTPTPATPTISVSPTGLITVRGEGIVETTHQLSEADDADFAKGNIAEGVTIFGKVGTFKGGSTDPQLATYLGKPTVTMGGNTTTVAAGKISITVQKETEMRTYILYTPDGIDRNSDADMCVFTCSAENDVSTCKWATRGKSAGGLVMWSANAPSGWTITDNGDGTVTIECAPTSGYAWWFYNTPARNWYAFRLNDAIGG